MKEASIGGDEDRRHRQHLLSKRDARYPIEKGAPDLGDRSLVQQLDDQGPRAINVTGRSNALMLTASNLGILKAVPALPEQTGCTCDLLAYKGYSAVHLHRSLRDAGAIPVISGRTQPETSHPIRQGLLSQPAPN